MEISTTDRQLKMNNNNNNDNNNNNENHNLKKVLGSGTDQRAHSGLYTKLYTYDTVDDLLEATIA